MLSSPLRTRYSDLFNPYIQNRKLSKSPFLYTMITKFVSQFPDTSTLQDLQVEHKMADCSIPACPASRFNRFFLRSWVPHVSTICKNGFLKHNGSFLNHIKWPNIDNVKHSLNFQKLHVQKYINSVHIFVNFTTMCITQFGVSWSGCTALTFVLLCALLNLWSPHQDTLP